MATSIEKMFVNIPQLKSEREWLVWKFQVTHALKAAQLWGYVTETVEEVNPVQKQKAFYCILQCIGQKYVPMVMGCENPREMWTTLCQFFERKTISNKVFTLMQFYGLRMKKGARTSEHLCRLDELADQLTAIGEEVKEIHKVAVLLRSVQDHYPTLVTALLARGDEELTMTFVKQSLLDEEQRQEKGGYSESGSRELKEDSALRAGRGKFHRRPGKPGNCYKCGKSGHFARNCHTQSAQGDQSDRTRHRAKKAKEAQEETKSDGAQESSYVVSTGLKAEERSEDWIIDSGASRHMTFQREILLDYKEFKSTQLVGLGDGYTVEALGTGCVKVINKISGRKDTTKYMRDVLYVPKLAGNLFSVRAAAQKELVLSFGHKYCWIRNKKRQLVGIGTTKGKLYRLSCEVCYPPRESAQTAQERDRKLQLWHQAEKKLCKAGVQGKMHRAPHNPLEEIRSTERLQLVHTDVCGSMQARSIGGAAEQPFQEEQPVQEEKKQQERPVQRSKRAQKPVVRYGIDDCAGVVYKACEIDGPTTIKEALAESYPKQLKGATDAKYQAGGGELIKCWASVQEKIQEDNQEATISFETRVREADGTTWSDVTTHRGGVL